MKKQVLLHNFFILNVLTKKVGEETAEAGDEPEQAEAENDEAAAEDEVEEQGEYEAAPAGLTLIRLWSI